MNQLLSVVRELSREVSQVYWTLLKIMVPTLIIVKLLQTLGAIKWLAMILSPVMQFVGLPDAMGLVWAAALLTNIYTGMAVYFELAQQNPLSIAQVSVLGLLLLLGHNLVIEGTIAKKSGVRWPVTLAIRVGGALVLSAILNLVYSTFDLYQAPAEMLWAPDRQDDSLMAWGIAQVELLLMILVVIATLMAFLRLLRFVGIEAIMHRLLDPLLRMMGIGKQAANTTVIGITLGLAFGGGLLIREAQSGQLSKKDILLSMCFLGLCHSLIEDTLLVMLLGAHWSAIFWGRLVFAVVVITLMARWLRKPSGARFLSWSMQ
jgi:hypothetical protein